MDNSHVYPDDFLLADTWHVWDVTCPMTHVNRQWWHGIDPHPRTHHRRDHNMPIISPFFPTTPPHTQPQPHNYKILSLGFVIHFKYWFKNFFSCKSNLTTTSIVCTYICPDLCHQNLNWSSINMDHQSIWTVKQLHHQSTWIINQLESSINLDLVSIWIVNQLVLSINLDHQSTWIINQLGFSINLDHQLTCILDQLSCTTLTVTFCLALTCLGFWTSAWHFLRIDLKPLVSYWVQKIFSVYDWICTK